MNKALLLIINILFATKLAAEPLEWPSYGGGLSQNHFINDASINISNVKQLKLKWLFQTGIVGSFENTPIVKDGIMRLKRMELRAGMAFLQKKQMVLR